GLFSMRPSGDWNTHEKKSKLQSAGEDARAKTGVLARAEAAGLHRERNALLLTPATGIGASGRGRRNAAVKKAAGGQCRCQGKTPTPNSERVNSELQKCVARREAPLPILPPELPTANRASVSRFR